MRLAIFDVDGTLVAGKSTEKRFIAWMLRRGYIGPRQLLAGAWFVLRWSARYGRHVFRKNKAWLSGLDEDAVAREAAVFVSGQLSDADWIAPAVAELSRHLERGDTVVLLSGSPQPIVDLLCRRFGAAEGLGTQCDVVHGRYTAAPATRHPFFDDKVALLSRICEKYDVAAKDVSAYADSRFDIPLLASVGHPAAVCPDRGLAEWATANNSRIIQNNSQKIELQNNIDAGSEAGRQTNRQ
ncbi:MAG TPA: HAD-IB family phosphatase [Woeseiaceae bacterium]|nr:HAD-IB family phosphatase [Woeseiaceae bacterium]